MDKNAKSISWKLFEKTGSPVAYLLYSALGKDELEDNDGGKTQRTLHQDD